MKKVSFGILQKLFGNRCRVFGVCTQSSAPADQPHRRWSAIGAGVFGVSYCGVGAHIV